MPPNQPTIEQRHRDAAAALSEAIAGRSNGRDQIAQCRAGKLDDSYIVQAFALYEAQHLDELRAEIINTPETADFMAGVPIEAAHQRERWGADHDAGKSPFDWFWLIGYLSQKAAAAAVRGDTEKAMHHTISTAAALANWHAALSGKSNAMRPGIDARTALGEQP